MSEIVKVQRPTSHPNHPWLVYGEGRTNVRQFFPCAAMRKTMGDDFKAFFEAELVGGEWHTGERVADQTW